MSSGSNRATTTATASFNARSSTNVAAPVAVVAVGTRFEHAPNANDGV